MKLPRKAKKTLKMQLKRLTKYATKRSRKLRRHKHSRKLYILVGLIATGVVSLLGWYFVTANNIGRPERLITFHDRGKDHVILTGAITVRAALDDANIGVAPQDIVEPAVDSLLLSTDSAVIIYRSRPVLVIDGAVKQKVVTAAAAPNEIATAAGLPSLSDIDKAKITEGDVITDGASTVLTIERTKTTPTTKPDLFKPLPNTLTASKGAQLFTDSNGVAHRETYYDLPMNIVIGACSDADYSIRYDGAKIDKDGYVLVAANYAAYPKCSIVETSMGLGKVYDTGGFALRYPHGFDLATDWTNGNGR